MSTSGPLWKCPRPDCEYVAQLLPASNLEMVIRYHEATNHAARGEPEFSKDPSVGFPTEAIGDLGPTYFIFDDPPPDPDRPWSDPSADVLRFYRDRIAEGRVRGVTAERVLLDEITDEERDAMMLPEVRCGTWVVPAACAVAAAVIVYLSYRAGGR